MSSYLITCYHCKETTEREYTLRSPWDLKVFGSLECLKLYLDQYDNSGSLITNRVRK